MGSLSNLYISQSYQSLIHLGNDTTITTTSVELQDGAGNGTGVFLNSLGDVFLSGSLSASLEQGYTWVGDSNNRTKLVSTSSFGSATDLTSLNAFTASQETKNATLASVTASLNANTASQQSQINSLISATGSYALTSSIVPLTSLNAYTASQDTKNSTLATYTASVDTKFTAVGASTASLNAFTSSQDTKNSTLASVTSSLITSASNAAVSNSVDATKWNTLGGQTGSYVTSAITASSLVTASVNLNTITFTKGNGTTFAVTVNTGSGGGTSDLTSLNAFTASQDTKNATLATYTASVDTKFVAVGESTASLNSFTASQNTINNNVANSASLYNAKFDNIASQSGSWVNVPLDSLNAFTASQDTKNSTLASVTSSLQQQLTNIGSQSGSWITESETGSFAYINKDNAWSANQTFTNITAVSASFTYVQTTYETSSIIYSSGSNQFGDEISDIQTLSGSVKVQGSLTVNGTPVQTSSVDISSLNSFTSSQEIKNSTLATYTASVDSSLTNINSFTASNGNTSLNTYTASNDTKWSTLGGQTGSYVTSAITASSLVTASIVGSTITFTKGDASQFNITIPASSTSFTSSISVSGSITVSGSVNNVDYIDFNTASATPTWQSGRVFWDNTDGCLAVYNNEADVTLQVGQENWTRVYNSTGLAIANGTPVRLSGTHGDVPEVVLAQSVAISGSANITNQILGLATHTIEEGTFGYITTQGLVRGLNTNAFTDGATLYVGTTAGTLSTTPPTTPYEKIPIGQCVKASPGTSGIIYVAVEQPIDFSDLSSVTVGTYANGDMWYYSGSGVTGAWSHRSIDQIGLVTTASFNAYTSSNDTKWSNLAGETGSYVTSAITASSLVTASFSGNTLTFTKGDASTFGVVIPDVSGSTINTGSFATTGSNVFVGDQTLSDGSGNNSTISTYSGSIALVAKSYTSGSAGLSYFSASANQVNLIFKATSTTSDTVISGSNNIIANPTTPTAGFKRVITTGNIGIGPNALPQFSASMAFSPTVNGNYFASPGNASMVVRGPVSSSTYSIQANVIAGGSINLGTSTTLTYEKAVNGTNFSSNYINGQVNVTAYKTTFTGGAALSVGGSSIGGQITLNQDSSSISFSNNTHQGNGTVINNSYYNAAAGNANGLAIASNAIFGNSHLIQAAGANTSTTQQRQFVNNLIAGYFNTASVNLSGDLSHMVGTAILGHSLSVTGSSATSTTSAKNSTFGSVFLGRFNAEDGNRARTAETVFAVGTGTTTARKTGFLIDSGSNTFVEGTLNVSGALNISGGVYSPPISLSITSQTASLDATLGSTYTLTLVSGSTTHILLSGQRLGQTYNLLVTQPSVGTGSIQMGPNVYQPSGSLYIPTPTSNAEDILTFVTFNNTAKTYIANVTNFI